MIHTKTVVMLGGNDDVFHSRVFCQFGNLPGIEHGGIKVFGNRPVFVHRNVCHVAVHQPFTYPVICFTVPTIRQF
ncbi:hypothetical protein SDC9_100793 [bioreactor metagenome]|uniref:Uncharacterized protein n=1 Tax=bioreactor metagenome TaxID=1076179 RepID=A0A645ANZ6_9ZZZZ